VFGRRMQTCAGLHGWHRQACMIFFDNSAPCKCMWSTGPTSSILGKGCVDRCKIPVACCLDSPGGGGAYPGMAKRGPQSMQPLWWWIYTCFSSTGRKPYKDHRLTILSKGTWTGKKNLHPPAIPEVSCPPGEPFPFGIRILWTVFEPLFQNI
jgi:hypothetical protein